MDIIELKRKNLTVVLEFVESKIVTVEESILLSETYYELQFTKCWYKVNQNKNLTHTHY